MPAHRIQLKGPWEYEWLQDGTAESSHSAEDTPAERGRVKMPASWQSCFGNRAGQVQFRRRFHRPTNLDAHERVFIHFEGIRGTGRVLLGEQELGPIGSPSEDIRFELTGLLELNNELIVELECNPERTGSQPGGLWGVVAIEIQGDESTS